MDNESFLEPGPQELFKKHLEDNVRLDKRGLSQSRKVEVVTGSISNANGSSKISLGHTVVICGIKGELTIPTAEEPDKGLIIPNVDLPALCSPKFKPGPPSEAAQVATKFLDNLVRNVKMVEREQLCVQRDKLVWVLFCDIVCLNYDGNLLDACVLALAAALQNVKLPEVSIDTKTEQPKADFQIMKKLVINCHPVASTFALHDKHIVFDPTMIEEEMTSGLLTIVVDESGTVVYIEKPGGKAISQCQFSSCIAQARAHSSCIKKTFYENMNYDSMNGNGHN